MSANVYRTSPASTSNNVLSIQVVTNLSYTVMAEGWPGGQSPKFQRVGTFSSQKIKFRAGNAPFRGNLGQN